MYFFPISEKGETRHCVCSTSSRLNPYQIHQNLFGYKRKSNSSPKGGASGGSGKKAIKDIPWTHNFVCLHDKDTETVPTDYALLTAKRPSFNCSSQDCGGYKMLRTYENTKKLNIITPHQKDTLVHS